jgi:hypothetical protein
MRAPGLLTLTGPFNLSMLIADIRHCSVQDCIRRFSYGHQCSYFTPPISGKVAEEGKEGKAG